MTGVLDGVEVLDLSWGIPGQVATMLMADHGASVTKIDPPTGDPFEGCSGYPVWLRGKRRATLDLGTEDDAAIFASLAARADVVVTSFGVGVAERLGVDAATLCGANDRLVHCSITGYGHDGPHADRPGIDALVGARTGHQWEHRGLVGGTIDRLSGGPGMMPGLEPPSDDCWIGPDREGPMFGGVPWISMATAYQANLVIMAALRARERTGRGQAVHTSLFQGALATSGAAWQRAERPDTDGYQTWIIDPRAPKGFYRSSDGRWTHHWAMLPSFVLGVSGGDELGVAPAGDGWEATSPRDASMRIGLDPAEMTLLHHYHGEMRDAIARYPADDWVRVAAEIGAPVQIVRSPEDALADPTLHDDGCVIEVTHPDHGAIRQVGEVLRLAACPADPPTPPVAPGTHTAEVRAAALTTGTRARSESAPVDVAAPLAGVRVIDLGLAVAGPWGTQLLADLGADVIKVNALHDGYWMGTHMGILCNRGKRSIALDLKDPECLAALHALVAGADIVQHNLRYDAAVRLGVGYDTLRGITPDLIYCHTRGFDRGERDRLPGNDQTGSALAGPEWLDGGTDDGGTPFWTLASLGDTGNGFLSAIGMIQALYHRDRTGEGQFVDTSILYAHLLNASMCWTAADGTRAAPRPRVGVENLGWSDDYRLYETADGWLCVAVVTDAQRDALHTALRLGPGDHPVDHLEAAFRTATAPTWFERLDGLGVPCEVSSPDFVLGLYDDPDMAKKHWTTTTNHRTVGRIDAFGLLFDLEQTPGTVQGPAPLVGEHTRQILGEAGLSTDEVDALVARGAAGVATPG